MEGKRQYIFPQGMLGILITLAIFDCFQVSLFFDNLQPLEQIALLYTVARQVACQCYLTETLLLCTIIQNNGSNRKVTAKMIGNNFVFEEYQSHVSFV